MSDEQIPWRKPSLDRRVLIILGVPVVMFVIAIAMSLVMPDHEQPAQAQAPATAQAPAAPH
jgi:hypothetical protein